jgi:hypothetical protein
MIIPFDRKWIDLLDFSEVITDWYWVSFVEDSAGAEFLGGCFVRGSSIPEALGDATRRKLAPIPQCLGFVVGPFSGEVVRKGGLPVYKLLQQPEIGTLQFFTLPQHNVPAPDLT